MTVWRTGGGDVREIERQWTFPRYHALLRHFAENGPPLYASLALLAGVKLKESRVTKPQAQDPNRITFTSPGDMASAFAELMATGAFGNG